jgi:glycosyltransferase involved in cell wall biosynthesis
MIARLKDGTDLEPIDKLRVLLIIDHLGSGGAQVFTRYLARELLEHSFDITICALRPAPDADTPLGIKNITLSYARYNIFKLLPLIRLIGKERFQIVHTHLFASSFLGTIAARVTRVPIVVCHDHSGRDIYNQHPLFGHFILRPLQRLQAFFVDHYITVSSEVYDFHRSVLRRPRSKIHVIRNWFLRAQFASVASHSHRAIRAELGIPHNHLVIGSVGRLSDEKGYCKLLYEFARCLPMRPNLSLILVGDGDQKKHLRSVAKDLEISSHVHLVGQQNDVAPFYSAFDIYIQPSDYETFGIAVLEAMVFSVPVIVSDVGGLTDIVSNRVNGLLYQQKVLSDLGNCILLLAHDVALRNQLAKAGHEFAVGKLANESPGEIIANLFREWCDALET